MGDPDDFARGFDSGHKAGFEHGFIAAKSTFEKLAFELDRQISRFPDEKISDVYQEWFGKTSADGETMEEIEWV